MLAILTTHPIQYQVPLWQQLARDGRVPFEVWYLTDHGTRVSFDDGFRRSFSWDLETLSGYPYRFIGVCRNPDVSRFRGVRLRDSLTDLMMDRGVRFLWVNGWQVQAYWQAVWRAHALGVPVWLRGESNDLDCVPAWKAPMKRLLLGQLFSRIDEFLCIGSANRRLYRSFGIDPQHLHASPYAVDNVRFAQQAEALRPSRAALRQEWGISQDAFCVLFAGKFVPKKRPMDVVLATKLLSAKNAAIKIHLLFAGSGELGPQLRASCDVRYDAEDVARPSRNGAPVASFTGFLNQREISKAYVAADCLVLPSESRETWGLVVNEAMASGLPPIVSTSCGCAEDLVPRSLQYRPGDIDNLAARVETIARSRPTSSDLSEWVQVCTFQQTIECVSRLYSSCGSPFVSAQANG